MVGSSYFRGFRLPGDGRSRRQEQKSRRGGTPEVFDRVGLLANEPPGTTELLST